MKFKPCGSRAFKSLITHKCSCVGNQLLLELTSQDVNQHGSPSLKTGSPIFHDFFTSFDPDTRVGDKKEQRTGKTFLKQ